MTEGEGWLRKKWGLPTRARYENIQNETNDCKRARHGGHSSTKEALHRLLVVFILALESLVIACLAFRRRHRFLGATGSRVGGSHCVGGVGLRTAALRRRRTRSRHFKRTNLGRKAETIWWRRVVVVYKSQQLRTWDKQNLNPESAITFSCQEDRSIDRSIDLVACKHSLAIRMNQRTHTCNGALLESARPRTLPILVFFICAEFGLCCISNSWN